MDALIILLAPFTPHIAEEFWEMRGHKNSVFEQTWPIYDEEKMKEDRIEMAVQINGKVRDTITVGLEEDKEEVLSKAKTAIADRIQGKTIVKEIYVPNKIINIVVK